jgi:hypothetical protein
MAVLEARLAHGPGTIDLSLRVLEPDHARRLAERLPWPHLASFLRRWAEPGGPFAQVRSVWLEYDLDRGPQPVVCAKLPPDAGLSWVMDSLLPAIHGKSLSESQRRLVRLCHEAIPLSGSLLYVFSLLPRGTDAVRMELFGLNPAEILDYLGAVAPNADPRVAAVAPLFDGVERIHLSFDIASTVLPRIGIEGSFSRLPVREPRWRELLERLSAQGLCPPEKLDALLSWTGYDTFWTAPKAWPVEAAGVPGFCVRGLSHVKLVCNPDRDLEAKVYLMFGPPRLGEGRSERQAQLAREPLASRDIVGDP